MPKFTDKFITNLKADGRYTSDTDTGFQIKSENGRKYFVYRYEQGKKRHDLTLGSYPKISLKEARKRYADARAIVIRGGTPKAYWRKQAEPESHIPLFKDFLRFTKCFNCRSNSP